MHPPYELKPEVDPNLLNSGDGMYVEPLLLRVLWTLLSHLSVTDRVRCNYPEPGMQGHLSMIQPASKSTHIFFGSIICSAATHCIGHDHPKCFNSKSSNCFYAEAVNRYTQNKVGCDTNPQSHTHWGMFRMYRSFLFPSSVCPPYSTAWSSSTMMKV